MNTFLYRQYSNELIPPPDRHRFGGTCLETFLKNKRVWVTHFRCAWANRQFGAFLTIIIHTYMSIWLSSFQKKHLFSVLFQQIHSKYYERVLKLGKKKQVSKGSRADRGKLRFVLHLGVGFTGLKAAHSSTEQGLGKNLKKYIYHFDTCALWDNLFRIKALPNLSSKSRLCTSLKVVKKQLI